MENNIHLLSGTKDMSSSGSGALGVCGVWPACKTSSLAVCRRDMRSEQIRRSAATWHQDTWKAGGTAGHWQEAHRLLTAVGTDSPPTHRRAVKHNYAAGDIGRGDVKMFDRTPVRWGTLSFNPLRASRNGCNQNYLV